MKRRIHKESVRKWNARKIRTGIAVARSQRHRVVVYRSAKHIYALLVEPETGRTLGSVSTRSKAIVPDGKTGNVEAAKRVGTALAELAARHQVSEAVFNRNGFLYHGRVKALAEAAREAGLQL